MAEFTHRTQQKLKKAAKLTPALRTKAIQKLRREICGWTDGAFKLCADIQAVKGYWLAELAKLASLKLTTLEDVS
jgi:hypothetical protein